MADDHGPRLPAGKQVDDSLAAASVEVVGRFVQQKEIGFREDECGESGPRSLPTGKRLE